MLCECTGCTHAAALTLSVRGQPQCVGTLINGEKAKGLSGLAVHKGGPLTLGGLSVVPACIQPVPVLGFYGVFP